MSDHQFKLQINLTKSYVGEDGGYYLEGIALGPEVDLTGERMSPDALKSMVSSIQKRLIEFRDAHKDEWNDDLGEIVELSLTEDNHLFYKSKLDMNLSGAKDLWYRAHTLGKKYGVSIGGAVLKAGMEYVAELGKQVYTYFDVDLYEISITRQAAYQYSFANAVLKSLPKGHVMSEEAKQDEVTKTDQETNSTESQVDQDSQEETVAAEEQSDATPTKAQDAEAKEVTEEAAAEADAETENSEDQAEDVAEADEDAAAAADSSEATTDQAEVAKSAVLGSYAEADVVWDSIDTIAWNLQWHVWDVIANDDMEASEKETAVAAALAEFSRIVQSVASALVSSAPDAEARKAIEALRENAPEAVSKSLTETQSKVEELTKSLDAKIQEVETFQKSLDEKTKELETVQKSLAEKEAELEKRDGRKAIVFGKFDGVELAKAAPQPETKSPTLSRWMNS